MKDFYLRFATSTILGILGGLAVINNNSALISIIVAFLIVSFIIINEKLINKK